MSTKLYLRPTFRPFLLALHLSHSCTASFGPSWILWSTSSHNDFPPPPYRLSSSSFFTPCLFLPRCPRLPVRLHVMYMYSLPLHTAMLCRLLTSRPETSVLSNLHYVPTTGSAAREHSLPYGGRRQRTSIRPRLSSHVRCLRE